MTFGNGIMNMSELSLSPSVIDLILSIIITIGWIGLIALDIHNTKK